MRIASPITHLTVRAAAALSLAVFAMPSRLAGAGETEAPVELVEVYQTPGIETELSGIFPHPTDNDLYYVVTNGKPPYKPTMTPMLDESLRNTLLLVHKSGEIRKVVELPDGGGLFGDIAFGGDHLWLGPLDPPELWKVDPESGKVVAEYSLPGPAGGLDYDRDRDVVYVHNYIGHPHIAVIEPDSGAILESLWSDENCQGIAFVDGDLLTVWTSSWEPDAYTELWQLDPATGRPTRRMAFEGIHAGMAPLDPKIAGYSGFMTLTHVDSGVSGKTEIHRYRYRGTNQRAGLSPPPAQPRSDGFAVIDIPEETADRPARIAALEKGVAAAAKAGARYVALPELTLLGDLPPKSGEPVPGPTTAFLQRLAERWEVWIAASLTERAEDGTGYHVTSVLVTPHEPVAQRVRKRVLRQNGDDGAAIVGFARWLIDSVDDAGRRVGVLSGDDLHAGVPRLADRGADTVLVTANWSANDPVKWIDQAAKLAAYHQVSLVIANRDPKLSAILTPDGLRLRPAAEDGVIVATLVAQNANWRVQTPLGIPSVPVPNNLPFTPELVQVGRTIFFDRALSSTGTVACADCHKPDHAFSDGLAKGRGILDRETGRNVPSILNAAFRTVLQWDGNATTLEQQVKYPLNGHAELNMRARADIERYIADRAGLMAELRRVLRLPADAPVGPREIATTIAAYERTLVSGGSRFDRYAFGGDGGALNAAEKRGLALFSGKSGCASCHAIGDADALFQDGKFHTLGIGYLPEREVFADPGVGTVSSSDYAGMFFTPSLRNVALTAPYFHDGSAATLRAAIDRHFEPTARGARSDAAARGTRPESGEVDDLIAFLTALTGVESGASANDLEMQSADRRVLN